MSEAYIVAAVRTACGRKDGRLSGWHPADLAAQVIDALVDRTKVDPQLIDDVIMGCVSQVAEQACNIARCAVLSSKLPESVPATTVDRQCGSSQQALHFAAQAVMSGSMDIVIAAGVESMSRVPMDLSTQLPLKNGFGIPVGVALQKRYPGIQFSQFTGAEMIARKYNLSKEQLDEFAVTSHQHATIATQSGFFDKEIVPVEIKLADGTTSIHKVDEGIRFNTSLDLIRRVKLLHENGRLTAATSSQISDGASGVMVANERGLKLLFGLKPLARVHHMTVVGHDPVIMLEGPIPGTEWALKRVGMKIDDIDLYEVNEAFASVPLAWLQKIGADPARLNVNGGAIALGHPLGASGTRLMTTLVHALHQRQKRYGLQTMCEGGGLANVTIIERL